MSATPPATTNLLSLPSLSTIVADFRSAKAFIPLALSLLPDGTRATIAQDASFVIEVCLALGGTVPASS